MNKIKILIVDNEIKNIQHTANILKNSEYSLSFAKDGEMALQRCQTINYDLILLDLEMPIVDGIDVCEKLKNENKTKDIPIIFIIENLDLSKILKAFEVGAADYIIKPVNSTELKIRVQTQINLQLFQKKNFTLLNNILPAKAIKLLKENNTVPADTYENVAILFSDLKGFTAFSSTVKAQDLISELNDIFTNFDEIMERHNCERIKTIGDAYMAVSGLNHSKKQENTTNNIVRAAVEMSYYLKNRKSLINKNWEMRIGINTGEVIGGIVGVKKYMYDIFGKTVNIAARMEQFSIAGKINLSEDSYNLVKDLYEFEKRDLINVKGIGEMQMYFLKYLEN
jgi:class 3 adenylate cyclase